MNCFFPSVRNLAALFSGVLLVSLILPPIMPAFALDIDALNARLEAENATWRAAPNPVSDALMDKSTGITGVTGAPDLREMREAVKRNKDKIAVPLGAAPAAALDWRDNNGDFVTGVRNQQSCGSCWAFAATATLESRTLISNSTPGLDLDLSEQISLSCTGGNNDCSGGFIGDVSNFLRDSGTAREACYPYINSIGDCADKCTTTQLFKVTSWAYATTGTDRTDAAITALKNAVTTYGPITVWMNATDEFSAYDSGVFQSSSPDPDPSKSGGHFVLLVGWNASESCFIGKNSWGTSWGEDGFFRIAESELKTGETKFGIFSVYYTGATYPEDSPETTIPGLDMHGIVLASLLLAVVGAWRLYRRRA